MIRWFVDILAANSALTSRAQHTAIDEPPANGSFYLALSVQIWLVHGVHARVTLIYSTLRSKIYFGFYVSGTCAFGTVLYNTSFARLRTINTREFSGSRSIH